MPRKKSGKSKQRERSETPPLIRAAQDFLVEHGENPDIPRAALSLAPSSSATKIAEGPVDPNGGWPLPLHEPREGFKHEVIAFRNEAL
jgi:hypothetical protein